MPLGLNPLDNGEPSARYIVGTLCFINDNSQGERQVREDGRTCVGGGCLREKSFVVKGLLRSSSGSATY